MNIIITTDGYARSVINPAKYATTKEERSVYMCVIAQATISKMRQLLFMRFQCFAVTVQPGKVQPGRSKLSPAILC